MIPTGSDPTTVTQGDFNGDGKPDLAYLDGGYGGYGSVLHILIGNGDGTFEPGQNIQLPSGIGGTITVADINKDGKLDIVLGGTGTMGQVGALIGNGDGTFQSPIVSQFPASGEGNALIGSIIGVADFNGDGAADLAAADQNQALYILLGNNTGSFTLKTSIFNGSTPKQVFTGDFNGDGHADFIVHGSLGADATVYLGNGDGTFQAGVRYAGIGTMLLKDMDGDGHVDLVFVGSNGGIDILHGNPDGTFASTSSAGPNYAGPAAGLLGIFDFNSDGILDVATGSYNGITILLGKGNLTYAAPAYYSGGQNSTSAVMADFNGDGHEDFAELAPGGIALTFGAASGTLQSADLYNVGVSLNAVAIADFNGDRLPDIAVDAAEPIPRLLLGTGGGKFSIAPDPNNGSVTTAAAYMWSADFNGDGKPDLLLTSTNSPGTVFFGNGNGAFGPPVTLTIPNQPGSGTATVGDFNNDGRSDIAEVDYESLNILLGQLNDSFTDASSLFYTNIASAISTGDFNNDGKLDLIVSQDESNPLQILLGNGDGTFQSGSQLVAVNLPQVIVTGDFDGDGNIDIVACLGSFNIIQIYYGNGDGTFQDPVTVPIDRAYSEIAVADMNGDGKLDLIFSDGSVIAIKLNTGNRTFGPEEHYLAGYIANFVVGDVNGDGLPDIVVANGSVANDVGASIATTVTVLINQGAGHAISGQLAVTPELPTYAQPFTISLSIATQGSNPPTPTGTVALSIDDVPIAIIPVTSLNLTYTDSNSPPLPIGSHTIVAAYSGDKNYLASTFLLESAVDPDIFPTTTTLTAASGSVLASQTVRFTATVTSPEQDVDFTNGLYGTVVFRDGTTNLGTSTVITGGVTVFDTSLLSAGTHNVTATYLGYTAQRQQTASYSASTSSAVVVTVGSAPTSTSLTALPGSVQVGGVVSLTSAVTSTAGTPTGAVTFFDGSSPLSTQPLDGTGTAVFSATFGMSGTHVITASYQANASFAASSSATVSVIVSGSNQSGQSKTQLSAVQTAQIADGVTLTATVVSRVGAPAGQIIFMDGADRMGVANLNSDGAATYAAVLTTPGLHYLTSYYPGNSAIGSSVSPMIVERVPVSAPDFLLNLSVTSVAVRQGQSKSIEVTVISINGFRGDLSLSCTSLAPDISCSPQNVSLSSGATTTNVIINTVLRQTNVSRLFPNHINLQGLLLGAMLISFVALAMPRFSRRRLCACLVCLLLAGATIGCVSPHYQMATTPVGTYVVTVTAASANSLTPDVHSMPVQVAIDPQ